MVAGDFEQIAAKPAEGDGAGVNGIGQAGRPRPDRASDGPDGVELGSLVRVRDEARPGRGEHLAAVADLVGGGRLVQRAR